MNPITLYKSAAGEAEVMAFYDGALAMWPVPHDDIRVPTRLGETFVIASGPKDGLPVILLHGAASNAISWMGDVTAYAQSFRTYAVDIPGDPGRSAAARPSWNGPAYADWLADVLDGLGVKQTSLVGLSQGGWNALRFAANYPEKVSKLVLLSPAGVTADRLSFLLRAILYSRFGKRGGEALNRYVSGGGTIDPAVLAYMNAIMTNFRPRIEPLKSFTDAELGCLTMPVFLMGGARDAIRDVTKIDARLKEFAPRLTTRMYPDKGHVLVGVASDAVDFLLGKA
jgi:pimeloyl-ACP methyl ester carboxylesterase